MRNLFKRLVSLILAVVLCFSMGIGVMAEEAFQKAESKAGKAEFKLEEVSGEELSFKRPNRNAIER